MRPSATWRPRPVTHRTSGSPDERTRRGRPFRVGGYLGTRDTPSELGRPGAEDVDVVTEVAILARQIDDAATPVLHLQASEDLTIRSCNVTACILGVRHAAHVGVQCRPRASADVERLRPLPAARPQGCVQRRACPHVVPSLFRSVPELVLRNSLGLARTMRHVRPPKRRTGSRRAVRSCSREPAASVWRSIGAGETRTALHGPAGAAMAVSAIDFAALPELSSVLRTREESGWRLIRSAHPSLIGCPESRLFAPLRIVAVSAKSPPCGSRLVLFEQLLESQVQYQALDGNI